MSLNKVISHFISNKLLKKVLKYILWIEESVQIDILNKNNNINIQNKFNLIDIWI
jgi:hypothetical protein